MIFLCMLQTYYVDHVCGYTKVYICWRGKEYTPITRLECSQLRTIVEAPSYLEPSYLADTIIEEEEKENNEKEDNDKVKF